MTHRFLYAKCGRPGADAQTLHELLRLLLMSLNPVLGLLLQPAHQKGQDIFVNPFPGHCYKGTVWLPSREYGMVAAQQDRLGRDI